jgi:ABC-type nitrate/sulfonate/bicarbonate transport system substrate-binding protein
MLNVIKSKSLFGLLLVSFAWGAASPDIVYAQKKLAPLVASYSALVSSQSYVWIAKEAGYFENEGVDVRPVLIPASAQNAAALLSGNLDIAVIGGMGVMRAKLAGGDLYLIGGTKNLMAGSIVSHSSIRTPAELKGKRIAITRRGSNPEFMANAVLVRFGINPERDVIYIQAGGAPESVAVLQSGNAEAASVIPPHNLRAVSLGYHELIDITAMKIPFLATVVATTKRVIDAKGLSVLAFMRAIAQGVHRFQTDKSYALKVISKYTRSPINQDLELSYNVEGAIMDRGLNIRTEAVQATLDEIRKDTPKAAQAKPEDFVDLRFVNELKQSGYLDRLWK